ncbi:sugar-binding protein [Alkalicoccus halolimnae]|uniref:Sugar-binding protein n=1 Tax=Alkalicoccus halolimnae TaxID=1667239 RepID=A0A5C7F9W8_9BACI|nr:sugar-binding protein [Alkalicoccus halolimnae]TXF86198.1 sugar ABC transporter substrate-binding protein [Alkalicoccus halolimnae]
MKRNVLYSILIAAFIIAAGFSVYFYQQAQAEDAKIAARVNSGEEIPQYHFTLIGEEVNHDYWRFVEEGAKTAEEDYDVFVEYKGPERSNPEEQLKLLDMAVQSKVDGIIVQALNEQFPPLINQAVEKGIPVITIDTNSSDNMAHTYIGTDNYMAGQLAGEALVEDTDGEAVVGVLSGSFDNSLHEQRVKGFTDIVEQEEGIEVAAVEESNISRVDVEEEAYNMLTANENITAFYGTSSYNGVGIVAAARSLEKEEDMYVITFDAIDENIELLENGGIHAIVDQQPFEMGYESVEKMLSIIEGNTVEDDYHTDVTIIRNADLPVGTNREDETS